VLALLSPSGGGGGVDVDVVADADVDEHMLSSFSGLWLEENLPAEMIGSK